MAKDKYEYGETELEIKELLEQLLKSNESNKDAILNAISELTGELSSIFDGIDLDLASLIETMQIVLEGNDQTILDTLTGVYGDITGLLNSTLGEVENYVTDIYVLHQNILKPVMKV